MTSTPTRPSAHGFRRAESCHLEDLLAVLEDTTELAAYPHATRVEQGCSSRWLVSNGLSWVAAPGSH